MIFRFYHGQYPGGASCWLYICVDNQWVGCPANSVNGEAMRYPNPKLEGVNLRGSITCCRSIGGQLVHPNEATKSYTEVLGRFLI